MSLSQANQSDVVFAGKRGIPDEDAQPYMLQALGVQAQATNVFVFISSSCINFCCYVR